MADLSFITEIRQLFFENLNHLYLKSFISRKTQKQPSRGVLRKRCSENMQQIYRRTPMSKGDFNKVALQQPLLKNTSGRLLLKTFSENQNKTAFLLA